ncbi:unnamed protein product [Protopolystoma xenopodis]|uniref:Uncharacterized protein n=1 Tax=Protopolystoma xenopodis TaxID=117903 RepID=A0A448WMI4_9PLAT|nr:unnamed protein product [Protopolystoma xenopodis]
MSKGLGVDLTTKVGTGHCPARACTASRSDTWTVEKRVGLDCPRRGSSSERRLSRAILLQPSPLATAPDCDYCLTSSASSRTKQSRAEASDRFGGLVDREGGNWACSSPRYCRQGSPEDAAEWPPVATLNRAELSPTERRVNGLLRRPVDLGLDSLRRCASLLSTRERAGRRQVGRFTSSRK